MRAKAGWVRGLVGALAGVAVCGSAGCSEDWAIGDAGTPGDAGGGVAVGFEAASPDASEAVPGDASSGDSGGMVHDGSMPPPDGPSCSQLQQAIAQARPGLLGCTEGNGQACKSDVTDECGCSLPWGGNMSTNTKFSAAVAAFLGAGCQASCSGCPTTQPVCLATDGGAAYACYVAP
jgi:hypothetical protein